MYLWAVGLGMVNFSAGRSSRGLAHLWTIG